MRQCRRRIAAADLGRRHCRARMAATGWRRCGGWNDSLVIATGGLSIPRPGRPASAMTWRGSSPRGDRAAPGAGAADIPGEFPRTPQGVVRPVGRCRGAPRQDQLCEGRSSPIAGCPACRCCRSAAIEGRGQHRPCPRHRHRRHADWCQGRIAEARGADRACGASAQTAGRGYT